MAKGIAIDGAAGTVLVEGTACAESAVSTDDWATRATAWELAAFSLRYPEGDELTEAVESGEWTDAAKEIAELMGLELAPEWADAVVRLAGLAGPGADGLKRSLRIEATRLFVGAPDPVVYPYEGVWRAVDDGVDPLLVVNPHSAEVESYMRACGLGRPAGTNEPLDHVATECEFLSCLAFRAALGEAPAAHAYACFFDEHAGVWMGRFAEKLVREARHPLYRAAGLYLDALIAAAQNA